jgi:hypothetical protein
MLFFRMLPSLVLFTASVSWAQGSADAPLAGPENVAPVSAPQSEEEREVPPQEREEPDPSAQAAPEGELIPYHYRPENEGPPDLLLPRILAEAFGGVLGGVGMGIVGLLAGASALEDVSCSSGEVCLATLLIITVPAAFVGIPLGVGYAAEGLGGRGQFLPSLGGTLLGTGAGLIYGLTSEDTGGLVASLIIGPVLGAIVGYELSHAMNQSHAYAARAGPSSRTGPRVVPVFGATPRGGLLGGLAGSF